MFGKNKKPKEKKSFFNRKQKGIKNKDFGANETENVVLEHIEDLTSIRPAIYNTEFLDDIDAYKAAEEMLANTNPDVGVREFMDSWLDIKTNGAMSQLDLQAQNHKRGIDELNANIKSKLIQIKRELEKLLRIVSQYTDDYLFEERKQDEGDALYE